MVTSTVILFVVGFVPTLAFVTTSPVMSGVYVPGLRTTPCCPPWIAATVSESVIDRHVHELELAGRAEHLERVFGVLDAG